MARWYDVTARSYDRETGIPSASSSRVELIDTATNSIFKGCNTIQQVEQAYESFWNDLNSESGNVVFVSRVTPLDSYKDTQQIKVQ